MSALVEKSVVAEGEVKKDDLDVLVDTCPKRPVFAVGEPVHGLGGLEEPEWAVPSLIEAGKEGSSGPLSDAQVKQWKKNGFALVDGLLEKELVRRLVDEVPSLFEGKADLKDFGSGEMFPSKCSALNEVTLHPNILAAVYQLLGTEEVLLSQADTWRKVGAPSSVGKYDNWEQRVHVDYGNHTLVAPPSWDEPEVVSAIVYMSDVEECDGGTRLVAREGEDDPAYIWPDGLPPNPGHGDIEWFNDRTFVEHFLSKKHPTAAEFRKQLYAREVKAKFKPGTILLYRHDVWHRGTPVRNGTARFVQNLVFKRADAYWVTAWNTGVARAMYGPKLHFERILANLSVEQRSALGFPRPGCKYWNPKTLAMVQARYGKLGLDIEPYTKAVVKGE